VNYSFKSVFFFVDNKRLISYLYTTVQRFGVCNNLRILQSVMLTKAALI